MKSLVLLLLSAFVIYADENVDGNLLPALLECYNNTFLLQKDNRLPQNIYTLIEIIRKIESSEYLNMDLRMFSTAILHRFRQDGIVKIPDVQPGHGVTPYAPKFYSFFRHSEVLRVVPGNAERFPNDSITNVERCSLHSMLSSTIEALERGDESVTCRVVHPAFRRYYRDVNEPVKSDVETLSPDQIKRMTHKNEKHYEYDPNTMYPDRPYRTDYYNVPLSKCPAESGVLLTNWGTVSGGPLIAGIAAALEPQLIHVKYLFEKVDVERDFPLGKLLDNKWMATLAGDLAEVVLRQGPLRRSKYVLGVAGNWNSTVLPHWYFINSNENLELTAAELRGDIDGLILASNVPEWYSNVPELQLSQILDMYYSSRGVFDKTIRACNRRTLFSTVVKNEVMKQQTYIASKILQPNLSRGTINSLTLKEFADKTVDELLPVINSQLRDSSCSDTDKFYDFSHASVDLTLIIDTSWSFNLLQANLVKLLEGIEIGKYNSNFTIINAKDGNIIINSTSSILDFYNLNASIYSNLLKGFDLPTIFNTLEKLQTRKLNNEKSFGQGGQKSDVVLLMPHSEAVHIDQDYFDYQTYRIQKQVPDCVMLILTRGPKDRWSHMVENSETDLFSMNVREVYSSTIDDVVSRIKRVPKRLINTRCGANYDASGAARSFDDYVEPSGVNFYRMHPNYFFSYGAENNPTIKVRGQGWGTLSVCVSREPLHVNASNRNAICSSISSNTYDIELTCYDASLIQDCKPYYISVRSNSTNISSYRCRDPKVCRYPDMIKYSFTFENLVCKSSANTILAIPFIFIIVNIRYILF